MILRPNRDDSPGLVGLEEVRPAKGAETGQFLALNGREYGNDDRFFSDRK